jgi:glycosyltransferase involved in cell wall biosynthesis
MSDVMPYESTVFSEMSAQQVDTYCEAWVAHLGPVVDEFCPDVIHGHHVWLLSSLLKDVAPQVPVVTHCHATGLRQMSLAPRFADRARSGCRRNERFVVLHSGHAEALVAALGIDPDRVAVVGAGFREDLFRHEGGHARDPRALYVGKYSAAKGLPWLLDVVDRVAERVPGISLEVAGSGGGAEAEELRHRMEAMAPRVVLHGQLDQPALARLMRACRVCVLPSFYEGVPLVLVEAAASGCHLVSTALPGVTEQIAPFMGDALDLVDLPRLRDVDKPVEEDLPAFAIELEDALERALQRGATGPLTPPAAALEPFTWGAVFRRVETAWRDLV